MNREERYALMGAPTLYHRIAAIVSAVILVAVIVVILCLWKTLPEQVPTSYDVRGDPTDWGGRATLLITPIIGLAAEGVMSLVTLFPSAWNTGIRVTPENRFVVYRALMDLMADERLSFAVVFAALTLLPVFFEGTGAWVPAAILPLMFWPIVRYLIRVIRIKRSLG